MQHDKRDHIVNQIYLPPSYMYISKDVKEFVLNEIYTNSFIYLKMRCVFLSSYFWLTNTYLETKRKVNLCFVPVYDWKKQPTVYSLFHLHPYKTHNQLGFIINSNTSLVLELLLLRWQKYSYMRSSFTLEYSRYWKSCRSIYIYAFCQ